MDTFIINDEEIKISDDYKSYKNQMEKVLEDETKELVLDFTILWNLFEHFVCSDSYSAFASGENGEFENYINIISERKEDEILKIYREMNENGYFTQVDSFINFFAFRGKQITKVESLVNSEENNKILELLIYICYRVRCNLFHGLKDPFDLNKYKFLFLKMNELLSILYYCYLNYFI